MMIKKTFTSILSVILLGSIAGQALAANIGSVHGTQCQSVSVNSSIQNTVWGIENLSTSSTGSVTCAIQLTGNLDNSSTRGGLAPLKVTVTTQDWNKENKCIARLRNSNATGVDSFSWVTNTSTGSYQNFNIVDEYVDYLNVKGDFLVVECQLHKRVSGKNPPTIRAINVYNN